MIFCELLVKMKDANDAGHGEKEAGFRLSTWLMIMEHINNLEENLDLTNDSMVETSKELSDQMTAVSSEVKRNEKQISEEADRIMF